MPKGRASPKSQQRLRVFEAYRGRGKRTNDLWLVYSAKTNRDLILSSNRHLVHWLVFLETQSLVRTFDFSSKQDRVDDCSEITVVLADGSKERHLVRAGDTRQSDSGQADGNQSQQEGLKVFTDAELVPHVQLAMRWLKALAFSATMRDRDYLPVRLALIPMLRATQRGNIGTVIATLPAFEEPLVFGMLVRLSIEGHLLLDLSRYGFCSATSWIWQDGGPDVVT
jgi:hypothetical protein